MSVAFSNEWITPGAATFCFTINDRQQRNGTQQEELLLEVYRTTPVTHYTSGAQQHQVQDTNRSGVLYVVYYVRL